MRMTLRAYLRSMAFAVVAFAAAIGLVAFVLHLTGTGQNIIVLSCALLVAAGCFSIGVDYQRKRSFYRELERCARQEGDALWMTELVRCPDFAEGKIAWEALRAISKAANDDVAGYRRQVEEYREYIETWVHEAKSPLAAAHLMLENLEDAAEAEGGFPEAGGVAEGTAAGAMEGSADEGSADTAAPIPYGKLEALGDELRRVEGYIEQALFYARSETLDRDYLIRKYSLKALVSDAIKANAPALIAAHVMPICRNLDFEVFTDEKWIEFILGQIIQNSVKYADDEMPRIEFDARMLGEGRADEAIELTVRDNGCGVSEADVPRVFDMGFTGENGRCGKRSTGIGLYLVKRLCDKMGVSVATASRIGEGFEIRLRFSTNKFQYFD